MIAFTIILVLFISLITTTSSSCIPNDGEVVIDNNTNNNVSQESTVHNQKVGMAELANQDLSMPSIQDDILGYDDSNTIDYQSAFPNGEQMNAIINKNKSQDNKYNVESLLPNGDHKWNDGMVDISGGLDYNLESQLQHDTHQLKKKTIKNFQLRQNPFIAKDIPCPWQIPTTEADDTGIKCM